MLPPELADRSLELSVRRLANDLRYGQDVSPYVGSGVDYAQSRPFVDGDAVKDIDWRVTARSGRYHIKQYEALKSTPVYLLVDTSASMTLRSQPVGKDWMAMVIAGGLALAALRRLSPVGLLAGGSRDLHYPPSLSRGQVFVWLLELRRSVWDEQTLLAARIDRLHELLPSRSLVVVLSDLHDPDALRAVRHLAQPHDVMVVQLSDPAEQGRLRAGLIRGVEAETGRDFVAHGRSCWFGGDATETPSKTLKAAGIDYLPLSTDQPFVGPLRRFLSARGGLVRNTR